MINFTNELIQSLPTFGDLIIEVGQAITLTVYAEQMKAVYVLDQVQIGEEEGKYIFAKTAIKKLQALNSYKGVEVSFGETKATFLSPKGRFYESYIVLPIASYEDTYQEGFELKTKSLKDALGFTSKNQAKPVLTGINISKTHVCATDSYKLYIAGEYNEENTVTLIPSFAALVANYDVVKIEVGQRSVRVTTPEGWAYTSNILDGKYPSLAKILTCFNTTINFKPNQDFYEALKLASTGDYAINIANDGENHIKVWTEEFEQGGIECDGLIDDVEITISKESAKELCKYPGTIGFSQSKRPLTSVSDAERILFMPYSAN